MEILFKNAAFLTSRIFASAMIRVFPSLEHSTGCLLYTSPLLHKQYKTARTETRWHLLLKIRQMPIQTSASRGYVLFISGNKRHTKVLKLSAGLRTHPAECSKLGKTQIIKDAGRGMVRNTGFCDQNTSRNCIHNRFRANVYLYNCPEEIPRYGCAATSGA